MSIFLLSAGTLWRREIVRFLRQRSRIVGAFGQPILFWLILGSGFGESFRYPGLGEGGGYLEYFYPGILAMVILFTAIFSTIAVVEDRKERFLQAVLVERQLRSRPSRLRPGIDPALLCQPGIRRCARAVGGRGAIAGPEPFFHHDHSRGRRGIPGW